MTRAGIFESIVGLIVIVVAAMFLYYAYGVSGQSLGGGNYKLEAVFSRVDGVTSGADVRIAGVKVGTVTANNLNFDTYEANVHLAIEGGVPIPEDSVAKIVSDGILGGAHVAIEPGASEDFLREGDKITITQGSVDLLGLAVQAFTNPPAAAKPEENSGQTTLDPLGDF